MKYLLLILLLTSCYQPKAVYHSYDNLAAKPYNGEVKLLRALPKDNYKIIGTVQTRGFLANSDKQLLNTIKVEAALQGANAILLTDGGINTDIKLGVNDFTPPSGALAIGSMPIVSTALYANKSYKERSEFEQKAPKKAFAYAILID